MVWGTPRGFFPRMNQKSRKNRSNRKKTENTDKNREDHRKHHLKKQKQIETSEKKRGPPPKPLIISNSLFLAVLVGEASQPRRSAQSNALPRTGLLEEHLESLRRAVAALGRAGAPWRGAPRCVWIRCRAASHSGIKGN